MGRSRNEEFKNSALFHGTAHPFEVGELITPQGHPEDPSPQYAYATPDLDYARQRAEEAVQYSWEDANKAQGSTYKQWRDYRQEVPYRVFEVEPAEDTETDEQGNQRSKTGFRVIRQAESGASRYGGPG